MLEQFQPINNPKDRKDIFWQHHPPNYIKLVDQFFSK